MHMLYQALHHMLHMCLLSLLSRDEVWSRQYQTRLIKEKEFEEPSSEILHFNLAWVQVFIECLLALGSLAGTGNILVKNTDN